jgi:hypothetical protein
VVVHTTFRVDMEVIHMLWDMEIIHLLADMEIILLTLMAGIITLLVAPIANVVFLAMKDSCLLVQSMMAAY